MTARDELIDKKTRYLERIRTRNILVKGIREYVHRINQKEMMIVKGLDETIKTLP
jgi:ribosomal protein L7Ae-like RNA K-turn-binding protein